MTEEYDQQMAILRDSLKEYQQKNIDTSNQLCSATLENNKLSNQNEECKNKIEEFQTKLINSEQITVNKLSFMDSDHSKTMMDKDKKILNLETEIKRIQIENASIAEIQISQNKNDLARHQLDEYKKLEDTMRKKFNDEYDKRLNNAVQEKEEYNKKLIQSKLEEITKETIQRVRSEYESKNKESESNILKKDAKIKKLKEKHENDIKMLKLENHKKLTETKKE